ncbi:hypothetical protein [Actinopolymorpha alba]|nr:hypothetical protein [Actinopolymorpha alba]
MLALPSTLLSLDVTLLHTPANAAAAQLAETEAISLEIDGASREEQPV